MYITEAPTAGVLWEQSQETLAQMFSREFFEISKNVFFTEHLRATASDIKNMLHLVQTF